MVMKLMVIIYELNIQFLIKNIIQHQAFIWVVLIVILIEVVDMMIAVIMIMVDVVHQDAIRLVQDQDHMKVS
jgi:hypothetical protein